MSQCKKYTVDKIIHHLRETNPSPEEKEKYTGCGFGCIAAIPRGMNGFSYNSLLIPESIHVIVSPVGCGRHTDFEMMTEGEYAKNIYHVHLTETDIVVGTAVNKVKNQVLGLVDSLEVQPKAVTLLITCVDALLHTDYSPVGKVLAEKYGIRFAVTKMFAFLSQSKVTHLMLQQQSVYSLLQFSGHRNERRINMLGNTAPFSIQSDFIKVLEKAGFEVREIRDCKTFREYVEMGDARLNVVLNPNTIYAAEDLKARLGIPYVEFIECMDPEQIRRNYQNLERELGCKLEYESYYRHACERVGLFRELIQDKTFAIGNGFDYNAVKCAAEFAELGAQIKYVLIPSVDAEDLPYYERLQAQDSSAVFYLTDDYGFEHFREEDCQADVAVGLLALFLLGIFGPVHLMTGEEPFDFKTFEQTLDQMTGILQGGAGWPGGEQEASIYDCDWGFYHEGEHPSPHSI